MKVKPGMFKLEIEVVEVGLAIPKTLRFYYSSLKMLRQGSSRKNEQYLVLDERKYIRDKNGEYEPFAVFEKSIVTLSQMKAAVARLELEEQEKKDFYSPQQSKLIPQSWK